MSVTDRIDLALASRELATGREQLEAALAITDRRVRTEAIANALAHLSIAKRSIAEVVERHAEPKLTRQGVRDLKPQTERRRRA